MLDFEGVISLGKISSPQISHEPDNFLWVYGLCEGFQINLRAFPNLGLYDNLNFEELPAAITTENISSFGVKHVPIGFGASAFYVSKSEQGQHNPNARFVIPIHDNPTSSAPAEVF
ncbi:MAG: hypothetical protein FWB96_11795 [Defluviitaleaceae bacterium]|nr:hypothetical protein [Defluviitaleaceae bacterium]MCL2263770.1 hypothetical protein [Defluviitaleaceae bacterium]